MKTFSIILFVLFVYILISGFLYEHWVSKLNRNSRSYEIEAGQVGIFSVFWPVTIIFKFVHFLFFKIVKLVLLIAKKGGSIYVKLNNKH